MMEQLYLILLMLLIYVERIELTMNDRMIIQHLKSELNPDFRKEFSGRESCMNTY
jgi:hypothetical protein